MDFKIDELRGYFIRKTIGRRIEYHEEVESTNTEALHLAQQGAEEGTVVIAEAQSAGR
jgi:BirA family biotin operon repressor/biotin-[acetyl-CoA-carboxylase] ligase